MHFPVGPFINFFALFFGGILGGYLASRIPERVKHSLPLCFGLASIGIGITLLLKYSTMAPIVLSFIVGVLVGELFHIEAGIGKLCLMLKGVVGNHLPEPKGIRHEVFLEKFVGIAILFCISGMGIFGSLNEGFTGDYEILEVKSVLDFFTSVIFASTLGYSIAFLCVPMLAVQLSLFCLASVIMPILSTSMIGDFSALGGLIMIATGLRIAEIKAFAVANMLPGLILVLPFSWAWSQFFS